MQFVVPQFIEVESKIIGPISARQFIILMAGGGMLFLLYKLAPLWLLFLGGFFVMAMVILFGFAKVNSQPFHWFFLNLVQTFRRPRMRFWYRDEFQIKEKVPKKDKDEAEVIPRLKIPVSNSRLAEMALLVDTGGVYVQPELIKKPVNIPQPPRVTQPKT